MNISVNLLYGVHTQKKNIQNKRLGKVGDAGMPNFV